MSTVAVPSLEQTLKNLLNAFNLESNTSARYTSFALKADEEGLLRIGSLFRAVARAEHIHAANQAGIIHRMSSKPKFNVEPLEVKSTAENLKAAIAGETHEVDVMYPAYLQQAEVQGLHKARRTFKMCIEAERDHARLFTNALEHLQQGEGKEAAMLTHPGVYYVCPECGFTATKTLLDHCPVCNHSRDEFELIE